MITDERADQAFHWLNDNTGVIGRARGAMERTEILRKRTRKRAFVGAPDGSVASKEAQAELHVDVIKADEEYVTAVIEFETLKGRQQVEVLAIDVWRTEAANRRRG
jgi:hypothetical protein